jgi:hypothetical protein
VALWGVLTIACVLAAIASRKLSALASLVTQLFSSTLTRPVERYEVPGLGALNFVLHRPANESVTRSLPLDAHGKTLSFVLLNMEIDVKVSGTHT